LYYLVDQEKKSSASKDPGPDFGRLRPNFRTGRENKKLDQCFTDRSRI
jgi:hypothetical protein